MTEIQKKILAGLPVKDIQEAVLRHVTESVARNDMQDLANTLLSCLLTVQGKLRLMNG